MKLHEKTKFKKHILQHPNIKESADFIIDQYGCRLFSESARTHAI